MLLGDSVMHDASYGITAALQATGEATVATRTIDGFGLTVATNWPTSIPNLIRMTRAQLIVASWSWDQYGPTTPPTRTAPAGAVHQAAPPGGGNDAHTRQRCRGGHLHRVPAVGTPPGGQPGRPGGLQQ